MKIARISVTDWAGSVEGLTLEEEGFFWRMVRLMYARDGLCYDHDRENARRMAIDVRVYRRLLPRLLASRPGLEKPLLERNGDMLENHRVKAEIEKWCAANKARLAGQKCLNFRRTSAELPTEVQPISTPETNKNKDLGGAITNTSNQYHRKKTPFSPLSAAQKQMQIALNPSLAEVHEDVFWDDQARIQVNGNFAPELLKQFAGGDENRLRTELDKAAKYIGINLTGLSLMKAVRGQLQAQKDWQRKPESPTTAKVNHDDSALQATWREWEEQDRKLGIRTK